MSDSTQNLDQVSQTAIQRETTINALFDATSPGSLYGRRSSTSSGLTFGYYGGRFGGTSVANGTVAATASSTNYVVVHKTTYAVSISTSNANWNNSTTYGRAYLLTAGASSITSYEDHREGPLGILYGGGASGSSSGVTINAQTGTTYTVLSSDLGKLVTFSNASSIAVTLPQATGSFTAPFYFYARNLNAAGVVTITPTTSTINGAATLVLYPGQSAMIVSDGTNYQLGYLPHKKVITVAFSTTPTIDLSSHRNDVVQVMLGALTSNLSSFDISNGFEGQMILVRFLQDGTGGRTFAAGSSLAFSATITGITLSTAANKVDYALFVWDATAGKARCLATNIGF